MKLQKWGLSDKACKQTVIHLVVTMCRNITIISILFTKWENNVNTEPP